jgi:hypothetical protein
MKKRRNILAAVVFSTTLICWLIMMALGESFIHGPKTPQPQTGQVVPYNSHGDTFYVTELANDIFLLTLNGGVVLVFLGIAIVRMGKRNQE